MEAVIEKARDLGRLIGQTNEYGALSRARQRLSEDAELVALLNRMADLERQVAMALQSGQEPGEELATEYEGVFADLQSRPEYQAVVAAQANFEKVLARVNEEISKGIETGSSSRIILAS